MMPLHELYRMNKQKVDHKEINNSHTLPSSSTIMNFTHFAKPIATVKTNLQNIGLSSSRSESAGVKTKDEAVTGRNPFHEDESKVDRTSNQVLGKSGRNGQEDVKKYMEPRPAEVSSSVCSDNGAYRASDNPNQNSKGKNIYSSDSEWHSEDVEDEPVGIKRATHRRGGFGSKRNRSAEVHNLSERVSKSKINEKMRTLQELIPNCSKVDKASMLDEAIEYLKTLQLQVQIMSMRGGGLYTPMMLPAAMQHMHMYPFSPMGVAMQMGSGVPQFQGLHAFHGMVARPNPQTFRLPGPRLHMPMPIAPMFSYPRESVMNSTNPISIQCEATIGGANKESNLVLNNGRVSSTNDKAAFTLGNGNKDNAVTDKSNEQE